MKKYLLLLLPLLPMLARAEEKPCTAESARIEAANKAVRAATEQSTKAHAADPYSKESEQSHAAVMAAFAEQSAAKKALTACKAQQSQP